VAPLYLAEIFVNMPLDLKTDERYKVLTDSIPQLGRGPARARINQALTAEEEQREQLKSDKRSGVSSPEEDQQVKKQRFQGERDGR
jgi:hypothetical protein